MANLTRTLVLLLTLAYPTPALLQSELLGNHTINLRLKPMPAADVIDLLAARSRMVAKLSDGGPADEGRPWEVEGADQLAGLVVAVHFVETPVTQAVTQLLGCLGFEHTEQGNRVLIRKSARTLSAEQCRSVQQVATPEKPSPAAADRRYSWRFDSISALELMQQFSSEAGLNLVVPFVERDRLEALKLRVAVAEMSEAEALSNLFGCIGWTYERTDSALVARPAIEPRPARECSRSIVRLP